jgi:MraZ protein
MNGFLGTYYVNLDDKGRANVPAKFRSILEKDNNLNMVVCVMDDFLIVFPQDEWKLNEEKMNDLSAFDTADRNRLREFYSRADECEMKSGKVLVPSRLRKMAELNKEVVLVGMSRTFEIWSKDRWEKANPEFAEN